MGFQLFVEESSATATFQKHFALLRISFFEICFIIDETPRAAATGASRFSTLMLRETAPQIVTKPDIETGIQLG